MHITILTLYPEMFPGPLGYGLMGKALKESKWRLCIVNMRDFAQDAHKSVDAPASGGGAGMVMMAPVVDAALAFATKAYLHPRCIYLSPRGQTLTQAIVQELAGVVPYHPSALPPHTQADKLQTTTSDQVRSLVLLCGRFEGIDQRVLDHWKIEELSLGDFILTGGEVAAMALIESVVRLRPKVLGNVSSLREETFVDGLLEYPHYTRPRLWKEQAIPDVLHSGHHKNIAQWRHEERLQRTQKMRPDLWELWTKRHKCDKKKRV